MLASPSHQKWESFELIVLRTKDFLDDDIPLQVQGQSFVFQLPYPSTQPCTIFHFARDMELQSHWLFVFNTETTFKWAVFKSVAFFILSNTLKNRENSESMFYLEMMAANKQLKSTRIFPFDINIVNEISS